MPFLMIDPKQARRDRFNRRKAKHVRDIRHKDYICNSREVVQFSDGGAEGAEYNIARAANIDPITRGGGHIAGNPRFRDERGRHKQSA